MDLNTANSTLVQYKWCLPTNSELFNQVFGPSKSEIKSETFGAEGSPIKFQLSAKYKSPGIKFQLLLESSNEPQTYVEAKMSARSNGDRWFSKAGEISLDKSKTLSWKFCTATFDFTILVGYNEIFSMKINTIDHIQRQCTDLASFVASAEFSDITICTTSDGTELPAHRMILAARSPVFRAMFNHEELKENQKKRIEIPNVSSEAMKAFLAYLYSSDISIVSEYCTELIELADKYDVPYLTKLCLQHMASNLDVDNAAHMFYLADLHQLTDLKSFVGNFIANNRRKVRRSDGWDVFVKPNALLMQELFDVVTTFNESASSTSSHSSGSASKRSRLD